MIDYCGNCQRLRFVGLNKFDPSNGFLSNYKDHIILGSIYNILDYEIKNKT